MKIGNVTLKNQVILAPMAGVSDLPFRLLCKEQGAGLVCTEMVSAKAIAYHNRNTIPLLAVSEEERPVSLQLFGSDPDIISEMAAYIEERPFDILDLNMGCPVPKVVNNGEGSALMKTPELAAEIIRKVSQASSKPLTVKFRKGFTEDTVNAVEFAKMAEQNGAAAIAVHGRTREQYYSGKADWDIIAQVKEAVTIPVIASGDIFSAEDAIKCLEQTKCDGLMLARGVRGNPWLFAKIKQALAQYDAGEEIQISKPQLSEVVEMIRRHGRMQVEYKGEVMGMREMRKHVAWYTTGYPHSAAIRREANFIETYDQLEKLCDKILADSKSR